MLTFFPKFKPEKLTVPISEIEKQSFKFDVCRFSFQGFIDVTLKAYALLIAIRVFNMSASMKSILVASNYIGMVLSPFVVQAFAKHLPIRNTYIVGIMMFMVGCCILGAAFASIGYLFIGLICTAKILYKETLPFVTDVYNRNYPKQRRGQIIGTLFMILAISEITFSFIGGKILDLSLSNYKYLVICGALAAFEGGLMFILLPNGQNIERRTGSVVKSNFRILKEDKLFTKVLIFWSLMSIAFQMTFPLRTEYLANKVYGLNLSNTKITFLIIILPTCTRFLSSIFWGKIFDARNFAIMKIMINSCFLIGVPIFFFSKNIILLSLSAIALGLGHSGNLTAWQLWVTKVAPSTEKLSEYVSIDVAIMGIRDALASASGYYLLSHNVSLNTISSVATLLIFLSTIGFYKIAQDPRLN